MTIGASSLLKKKMSSFYYLTFQILFSFSFLTYQGKIRKEKNCLKKVSKEEENSIKKI